MFSKFFVVLTISAFTLVEEGSAASCLEQFKNKDSVMAAGKTCLDSFKALHPNKTFISNPEDLEKNHWDDHWDDCMANCTLVEMKLIVNNTLRIDAIQEMIKQNAPAEAQAKLIAIAEECAAKALKEEHHKGKSPKPMLTSTGKPNEGGGSSNMPEKMHGKMNKNDHHHSEAHKICKEASKFMHCFQHKEAKAC